MTSTYLKLKSEEAREQYIMTLLQEYDMLVQAVRGAYTVQPQKAKGSVKVPKKTISRCMTCGAEFVTFKSQAAKYCSKDCYNRKRLPWRYS